MNNTNTEEWGNIELPGLSDEKLLSTNWHKIAVLKSDKKREKNRQATIRQFSDPEARKKHSEITKKLFQNEDYVEKQKKANEVRQITSSKAHLELNQNLEWKKHRIEKMKSGMQTEEARLNIFKGVEKRKTNGWLEKVKEAQNRPEVKEKRSCALKNQTPEQKQKRANSVKKPVHTPLGIFASLKEAGLAYDQHLNFKNGQKYVSTRIKNGIIGFYYLEKSVNKKNTL